MKWRFSQPQVSDLPTPRLLSFKSFLRFALLFTLSVSLDAHGAVDWPVLGFTQVVTMTFSAPTCIAHAGDGSQRLFVTEQKGRVWIIQNNSVLPQPFLDITNRVLSAGAEQGLLGLVFPGGFPTKNHFYVNYTRQTDGAVVISRFQLSANSDLADTNSEQIILVIPKTYNFHNGGQLAFGPDGYLYIGVGDGGPEGDPLNIGQQTSTLLGKLLRIDVESGVSPYVVPANNPFVSNTNYLPEIWAYGLRNPWRFSFDRMTGDLYIGDVGQNLFEEIDFQPAGSAGGQNYGWRIMEGPSNYNVPPGFTNFSALTFPIAWYSHSILPSDGAAAVVSGYVYRGPDEPRMNGMYFYGDFLAGWIWGLKQVGTNWQSQALVAPGYSYPHSNLVITTFGEDDQGNLYLSDYFRGKIYQIQDTHQVWTPSFSAASGIINSNTVIVTCLTTNAEIHFTTNGVDPTLSDPIVSPSGIIQVSNGATNKARGFRADLSPSGVVTAVFTFRVGTPIFTPPAGSITNNTSVSISTVTPGATLYYTTNLSTPTTNSGVFSTPLTLSGGVTVRALGVAGGYSDSLMATAAYSHARVATPVFTPSSGPVTNGTLVALSCATPGAMIYYTLDGTTPTTASFVYSAPFTINGGVTVNAFAVASGYVDSVVGNVFYQLVQTATPLFSPASGPVTNGTPITMTCATPGSTIYYTSDGTTPTTNSAIYSVSLSIEGDTTLSAFAIAPSHLDSAIQSTLYTLVKAVAPTFNPSHGPLTNAALVAISTTTSNAVIRYTTDGSDPNSSSNTALYSNPISFTNPMTLTARAYHSDLDPSDAQTTFFGLLAFENTVVTTLAGGTTAGFSNTVSALATFSRPQGISTDRAGNLYVADTGNNVIRKISTSGQVTTYAGTGFAGSPLGPATNAQFSGPTGVAVDGAGNVYVADGNNCNRVCKIDPNGTVTLLANVRGDCAYGPGLWQLASDNGGNIYVGSWATVQEITPSGTVIGLAGTGCNCPGGWGVNVGPGVDPATNVYSATGGYLWITRPDGTTDLFAGGNSAFSDGPLLVSGFQNLQDAAVDAFTNIFLSDSTRVRKARAGSISTLAGTGVPGYRDGRGSVAQFNAAAGLCADTNGNIYVADSGNNCIRKISPDTAGIGIPDDWQLAHFGYIGIDPNADPDHDGMSNYAEFWAGTDPTDSNSALRIDRTSLIVNGYAQIRWQTVAGKTYAVQYSSDLISWNTLGNPVPGDGSVASVNDAAAISPKPQRYYRIVLAGF